MKEIVPAPLPVNQCGDLSFRTRPPVTLPERFKALNSGYECQDPSKLEEATREQANSDLWRTSREKRLTASNFSLVVKRKSQPSDKFLTRMFVHTEIHAAPLEHGKKCEVKAKTKYLEAFPGRHVHACGLVVNNEFPFLGASPDGKVCADGTSGLLEVKCPYTARSISIQQACATIKDFCLVQDENGTHLKHEHAFYVQVQGQLLITGSNFCDFVVYTHVDTHIERILPDVPFMTVMLEKLAVFFQDFAKPFLTVRSIREM